MTVEFICPHCGSDNVVIDAWCVWDREAQDWFLNCVHDNLFCRTCEETLEYQETERKIAPTPQQVYEASRAKYRIDHSQPTGFRGRDGRTNA